MAEQERLELIARQMENIRGGIRSLIYFRLLSSQITTDSTYFWLSTKIAHIEHFILSFSKSFGPPTEDLHWKASLNNKREFRNRMFQELEADQCKFKKYLKSLLKIRNQVVAHTDMELRVIEIPNFDLALRAFNFLYIELRSELLLFKEHLVVDKGPGCIKMWQANLTEEAGRYIQVAVEATKDIPENR